MKLPRLAALIIGLSFIFGLMLWLVNSIYRLYIQIAFTAPILANILLLLIIGLLGLLIYILLYYFYLLPQQQKSRRGLRSSSRPPLKLPVEKTEAAGETLKAIRQQVE
ncbi:MAG: GTP-binding protein, partial [Microcystis panniformis]